MNASAMPALENRATERDIEAESSRLGMQLGEQHWLLELADVSEVIPVPELQPVPFTRRWFAGIANVRGTLLGVVDLGAFLEGAPVELGERARLIVVADNYRVNTALLFSRVIGLRQCERFRREPEAPAGPWVEGYYLDEEQCRWSALAMRGLVSSPDFLRIELPATGER